MKPASALRLLRWIVLALLLTALGRASAQETHRLNLDQTRATLTATETALRDKNLDDAGLQALRTQSDAVALALQGAIAELTPRLADSAKRLDELTPKSGQPAPTTDVAAKDLENEKQRHDRLDANLRAARAMLLEANDVSTRISAARRQLFAERTFARSSSVLNPQLWAAVGRELPVDAEVVRSLIDNWLGAIGERPLLAKIGMAAIVIVLALAAAPLGWIARRFVYRDRRETAPSRLRRALAAAWTFVIFAALPLAGLGVLAGGLDSFDLSDPSMQGVIDAAFEAARVLIAVNALGRGMLAPGRPAWRLVPISDRSAGNPLSPRDDVCRDLGRRAVGRACGRRGRLAQYRRRHAGRRRDYRCDRDRLRDAPARSAANGGAGIAAKRGLDPLKNARLGGRVDHFPGRCDRLRRLRHFPRQSGDLPQRSRQRALHCRYHRPGRDRSRLQAGCANRRASAGDGGTAPQCARADLRRPAGRRPCGGACGCGRGGAEAVGRAVAGHVRLAALGLFRLLARRRHPVVVVDDRRRNRIRHRGVRDSADSELARLPALAADAS